MLQKNQRDDLRNFCAIYELQNADNARTLWISFDDKLKFMQQTASSLSEGDSSVCK